MRILAISSRLEARGNKPDARGSRQDAGSLAGGSKVEARMARGNRVEAVGPKPYDLYPIPYSLNPKPYSLSFMAADRRFGRYGPMDKHEVRGLKVEGTEIEKLRARREMLRSLYPEKAKTIIEVRGTVSLLEGMSFFEALDLAKAEGRIIVPHDVHDRILTETLDEKYLGALYENATLTGTIIIHESPDKPFGDELTYQDDNLLPYTVSFAIPQQFRGLRNCALVIDHPDFGFVSLGKNKYELKVIDEKVHQIQDFSRKEGWYLPDPIHRIPFGEEIECKEDVRFRHFLRAENSYIGPLLRGFYIRRMYIHISSMSFSATSVAFL